MKRQNETESVVTVPTVDEGDEVRGNEKSTLTDTGLVLLRSLDVVDEVLTGERLLSELGRERALLGGEEFQYERQHLLGS